MIVNVSGRTDIVAFYMEWFLNRLEEGFFMFRNPFYKNLVHRIDCKDIDMFVFCTKNPENLLKNIDKIQIPFVVQVTITPYGKDIEPHVPNKVSTMELIKKMARIIEKERIFVRYDPILLNDKYNLDYHVKAFRDIIEALSESVNSIIVSFVDEYKNVKKNRDVLNHRAFSQSDFAFLGEHFSEIASSHGLTVQTCGEEETLFEYGFIQNDCVTTELVEKFTGKRITEKWKARKNKNCHCVQMYDIGDYNSCKHFCKYCYANYSEEDIEKNCRAHDVNSPLLIGHLGKDDVVKKVNK